MLPLPFTLARHNKARSESLPPRGGGGFTTNLMT